MSEPVKHWDGPPLSAWQAWTPEQVTGRLAGIEAPWCVVGGWAIDLFLGRVTREHEDLEIAVPRSFFPALRERLEPDFAFHVVGDGEIHRLAPGTPYPAEKHQCWLLDEAANKWRLDIMQEPGDAGRWVFRRDERVSAPRTQLLRRSADGIAYLAPEAVLLFKAKGARPKDETDLAACLPSLSRDASDWLRAALTRVHPGHAWLDRLP